MLKIRENKKSLNQAGQNVSSVYIQRTLSPYFIHLQSANLVTPPIFLDELSNCNPSVIQIPLFHRVLRVLLLLLFLTHFTCLKLYILPPALCQLLWIIYTSPAFINIHSGLSTLLIISVMWYFIEIIAKKYLLSHYLNRKYRFTFLIHYCRPTISVSNCAIWVYSSPSIRGLSVGVILVILVTPMVKSVIHFYMQVSSPNWNAWYFFNWFSTPPLFPVGLL